MQITQVPPQFALPPDQQRMMDKAKELEAAFLTEMLSHAGLNTESESFGGGTGEEQFASFLRAEQAKLIVEKGGVGLAEMIFKSMVKAQGNTDGA